MKKQSLKDLLYVKRVLGDIKAENKCNIKIDFVLDYLDDVLIRELTTDTTRK